MNKRPTGLTVLAVINFIFAGLSLLGLVLVFASPELRAQTGVSLSYSIFSPLMTAALLLVSGIGFLKLNYYAGFVGGVVFCLFALCNILAFNALQGFKEFTLHIPSLIYPAVVILMLTLRYRQTFLTSKETTEQGIGGDRS